MPGLDIPDNTRRSFKCERCGNMFAARRDTATCPVCGYYCGPDSCRIVDASDEGY